MPTRFYAEQLAMLLARQAPKLRLGVGARARQSVMISLLLRVAPSTARTHSRTCPQDRFAPADVWPGWCNPLLLLKIDACQRTSTPNSYTCFHEEPGLAMGRRFKACAS